MTKVSYHARSQCKTCLFIVNTSKISGPKRSVMITDRFTCTSANVIYCITCTLCNKLYIGETGRRLQYSPKIMHAQEVGQEVLVPQEHASGQKKLNCGLSARTFKPQEAARSYELNRKTQKAQEVSGLNCKSSRCCLSEVIKDYVSQNINRFQKEEI